MNLIQALLNEGRIKLVEPSINVSRSYAKKSKNSLKAARFLLEQNLLEESISMAYYSMYHKATSLLYLVGIKCTHHAGTIIILKELFQLDDSKILYAKKERIGKQYYADFTATKGDAGWMIALAEEFLDMMDSFIDKITETDKIKWLADFKQKIRD